MGIATLGSTLSRRLTLIGLPLLAAAVLAVAGCGGDDAPAVCSSLETVSDSVEELRNTDLEAGEGAVADVEASLGTIRSDLETAKADAESELSEPIAGLESSIEALSSDVETVRAAGDITAESVEGLADSVAAVSESWEALKTAVPDCDL